LKTLVKELLVQALASTKKTEPDDASATILHPKKEDGIASSTTTTRNNKKPFLTVAVPVVEEPLLLFDDPNDPDQDPEIHTPLPRSPMVRLCRLLEQKQRQILLNKEERSTSPEEECPDPEAVSQKNTNKADRVRHVRMQVNGQWGYYSGPKIIATIDEEADDQQLLQGCVVRFTNGDLYLGSIQKGQFHGPGSLYPRQGSIQRGSFCHGKLLV
jgi:hypothetical protein